jgi:hypothetical protein
MAGSIGGPLSVTPEAESAELQALRLADERYAAIFTVRRSKKTDPDDR